MTLRILDVVQGSPEWLEARRGMITASVVGRLVTPRTIQPASNMAERALVAELAAERIAGWIDDSYQSGDMIRGHLDEPYAREAYTAHTGIGIDDVGLMVRDYDGFSLGYSPDGIAGDGLVEIKSRVARHHVATVLADAVPDEHLAQCHAALVVSGRPWLDYVSFCGGLALWVKRVYPNPRWAAAIVAATRAADAAITATVATYTERTAGLPVTERPNHELELSL
ncbi:MAG: YqaJ viral recombinase family protein [Tessaracoccus sp.]|uniref:lambda exonuclease family protein n=1 Tax=Tessaracoccus sp. TaxID=1971211 RepID=UPI001ECB9F8D|nr:lambda exonuclease family protein [Tessaracoccus sp.]MBK7822855.1 YqaJ viral recombinase family protein [Tessaracoccus sp.]